MSTALAETNGHGEVSSPAPGKAGGSTESSPDAKPAKQHKKQVVLLEDTQILLRSVAEQVGMTNDATMKAALGLLARTAERKGIRRKTNIEVIAELVGDDEVAS